MEFFFCNCNYILFTKLPWPGDSEGTFRSSSQATTCPPVYHTRRRLHTIPLIAERQAGKLRIPTFIIFGLTRPGIEPEFTASVADALSTRPFSCSASFQTEAFSKIIRARSPQKEKAAAIVINSYLSSAANRVLRL